MTLLNYRGLLFFPVTTSSRPKTKAPKQVDRAFFAAREALKEAARELGTSALDNDVAADPPSGDDWHTQGWRCERPSRVIVILQSTVDGKYQ